MIRMKINWKFSHTKIEILKITHDESEATIKIRWRVNGVRGLKTMVQPWKIQLWKMKESVKDQSE